MRGQNHITQVRDRPLHYEMAVADFLETFEHLLPLDIFDTAEWKLLLFIHTEYTLTRV